MTESGLEHGHQRDLLREYKLAAAILEEPDSRIPFGAYLRLIDRLATMTKRKTLGLDMGVQADIDLVGAVGHIFLNAHNLLQALKLFEQNTHYIQDSTRLIVQERAGGFDVIYSIEDQSLHPRRQDAEFSLGVVFNLITRFLPDPFRPEYVTFEHDRLDVLAHYENLLKTDVFFDQNKNTIGVSTHHALTESDRSSPHLISILETHLRSQTQTYRPQSTFEEQAGILINSHLLDNIEVRASLISAQMGLSAEQLNRRLKKENTNFRRILLERRIDIAKRLLTDTQASILEIANRVGYADSAVFCRAFRNHVGQKPTDYRAVKAQ